MVCSKLRPYDPIYLPPPSESWPQSQVIPSLTPAPEIALLALLASLISEQETNVNAHIHHGTETYSLPYEPREAFDGFQLELRHAL